MIHQLLYRSQANVEVSALILASIGHIAEVYNARVGLTGLLCHQDGTFMQVLEGKVETVEMMMDRIASDTRHSDIEVLERRDIAEREFGSWAMAIVCDQDAHGQELTERCFDRVPGGTIFATSGFQQIDRDFQMRAD